MAARKKKATKKKATKSEPAPFKFHGKRWLLFLNNYGYIWTKEPNLAPSVCSHCRQQYTSGALKGQKSVSTGNALMECQSGVANVLGLKPGQYKTGILYELDIDEGTLKELARPVVQKGYDPY